VRGEIFLKGSGHGRFVNVLALVFQFVKRRTAVQSISNCEPDDFFLECGGSGGLVFVDALQSKERLLVTVSECQ
jgi:hypothetical protein